MNALQFCEIQKSASTYLPPLAIFDNKLRFILKHRGKESGHAYCNLDAEMR